MSKTSRTATPLTPHNPAKVLLITPTTAGTCRSVLKLLRLGKPSNQPVDDIEKDSQIVTCTRTPSGCNGEGVCLATRYEAGPDGEVDSLRPGSPATSRCVASNNPHKNGRIPFVIKYAQPLFDSFYGLGDFQRAKPLQFARDGLINFYFKGIKMNLIPPLVALDANGVLKHTLDYREGGVMLETDPELHPSA
jgi:hypothetical protein